MWPLWHSPLYQVGQAWDGDGEAFVPADGSVAGVEAVVGDQPGGVEGGEFFDEGAVLVPAGRDLPGGEVVAVGEPDHPLRRSVQTCGASRVFEGAPVDDADAEHPGALPGRLVVPSLGERGDEVVERGVVGSLLLQGCFDVVGDLGLQPGDGLDGGGAAGDEAGEGTVAVDELVHVFVAARVQRGQVLVPFVRGPAMRGLGDAAVVEVVQLEGAGAAGAEAERAADRAVAGCSSANQRSRRANQAGECR